MTLKEELLPFNDVREHGTPNQGCDLSRDRDAKENSSHSVSQENADEKEKEPVSFCKMSSRKQLTLLLLCFCDLLGSACYGLLAPFFPSEAAAKGMSQTEIGLVFSCFEFWVTVSSPFFGNYMRYIGPKFAFISGLFLNGGCFTLFGFLYMCPPGLPFIALCFALRTVSALGESLSQTSSFALLATEFPDYVGTAAGLLATSSGIGLALSPLLGGALYQIGGFGLPFFVTSVLLLLGAGVAQFVMPSRQDVPDNPQQSRGSILRLLKSPQVVVVGFSAASSMYTIGFLESSLAIHLEQFHISAVAIGAVFLAMTVPYTALSIVFGWISDRKHIIYPFLIGGGLTLSVAVLFIGPSPLLPFLHAKLWLVVVCVFTMGASIGAILSPSWHSMCTGARQLGFEEGSDVDGMVAGLYTAATHGGLFFGPTIGSPVMQAYGFEWSATLTAAICFCSKRVCKATDLRSRQWQVYLGGAYALGSFFSDFVCSLVARHVHVCWTPDQVAAVITYVITERMCLKPNVKKNTNDVKTETSQLVEMHAVYDYKSDATHIQHNDQQKENATQHH